MQSTPHSKLHTFSLILGVSGVLALLPGCPLPGICELGFGAPTADAKADQNVVVGQRATLNGNASTDPDGDALTYQWQKTSGPAADLNNPGGAMASFVPQVEGVYVFTLTVSDGCNSNEQTVQISVFGDPDIGRPLANAGPDSTLNEGERSICLTGINSADPNGRPLTFSWMQLSGPDVFLSNPFVAEVCFDAPEDVCGDQSLVFELTAVNDIQLRDKDDVVVTVSDLDGECCTSDADCDDNRPCTEATCDTAADTCVFTLIQCPEGQTCDEMTGDCLDTDPCRDVTCDDGLFCNGEETCDSATGCVAGTSPCEAGQACDEDADDCDADVCEGVTCDDGDICTDDACAGVTGECVFTNNTVACDDGDNCTEDDACADGFCAGTPMDCPDGETCVDGVCVPCVAAADCDDGDACTDDSCVGGVCVFENNTAECDDEDACTENDVCSEGTCAGTAMDCDDGQFCDGVETCDSATGCVDGDDPCDPATETCDEDNGECVACAACTTDDDCTDDGVFCNGAESCDTATSCCTSSGDPCAAGETCDEEIDECALSCGETDTICSSEWVTGAIDTVVDSDTYTFTGQAGQCASIQMNRTSGGLDPQIQLFPPSGGDREAVAQPDSTHKALLFVHPLAETGQYTILLRDRGGDETGDYILSLLFLSGPLTSPQDQDGGVIAFDETKTGAIDPVVDMDVYTFIGQAGQRVTIQANRTSGGLDPQIQLFPPSGCDSEAVAQPDSTHKALLFVHPLAETGQYTILLRDRGGDETGDYIMSLSVLP